ncbi:ribonuclease HII [Candidatus Methylacidiphilum fumarolicum]|uniref:Ribonuclease HII n=2 Tax=Candidatus Methylacidiphilum fumarolicum TaxID=591154 RepID=I0JYK6_METFB|nr:ribonuclease HII [Candidatus Methylacidiphilum fumarolicum]MBW6415636.1 ribonuclease HII [Candidatus Methylacidiphilum fumarolicum]TFE67902.1 ribonuclease HII [Candidatus Methylacidiphilum fumarolicum]TFE71248.1 ribonuclease HII [Candidatus Methylacidiphilum fumarolicum]TFE74549.1 ribonuclease HII [Candidatus Methylacidiphilum fumarolicum]TFE74727.1 ribonuclease HII [Candidatus Methylacidiphilum fumarolicum]
MTPLDLTFEKRLSNDGYRLIAGIDEVGRGALAGPIVAAAVILPLELPFHQSLKDSKCVGEKKRESVVRWLIKEIEIKYGLGFSSVEEIEKCNVHKASLLAMRRAVCCLDVEPDLLLIDGIWKLPGIEITSIPIAQGDAKVASIAAASLVAKVNRDLWMTKLGSLYRNYGWDKNKGYGTPSHFAAIKTNGFSPFHRKSFFRKREFFGQYEGYW